MRISDWSSDVCSSDLEACAPANAPDIHPHCPRGDACAHASARELFLQQAIQSIRIGLALRRTHGLGDEEAEQLVLAGAIFGELAGILRSEEHTSELQSLMRISYAVFCLKKKKT